MLLHKSSDRELALFRFLEGKIHSFNAKSNDPEAELCSKAFSGADATHELDKLKKIKPFKGFHYSNNLITLIAASLACAESEYSNVLKYVQTHSYRDLFIVNKALNRNLNVVAISTSSVDDLARKLTENEEVTEDDVRNCISQTADLFDLFVVKQAIAKIWTQYEESHKVHALRRINTINDKIIGRLNILFKLIGGLIILWIFTYISPYIVGFVIKHWDMLEPIAYLLDKVILILSAFSYYKFINSEQAKMNIAKYYFTLCYWMLGTNYSEFISLKHELSNNG